MSMNPQEVAAQVLNQDAGLSSRTSHNSQPQPPSPMAPGAYYGLAGEIVREIEPHTEADPAAVLVQFLVAVGNAVGRGPGFKVEADPHYTNLNAVIVGATSAARKGSSWGQARRLVEAADPTWSDRIATGASSGEGLIWEVRDGDELPDDVEDIDVEKFDLGAPDKRLTVVEVELASALERMARDGNTLSAVVRQAWDGHKLDTLVKTNRATATNAHISIIGHITAEELTRKLSATESANGFANRFLWVYSTRKRELPFGGDLESVDWNPYTARLREVIEYGRHVGTIGMSDGAAALWVKRYGQLSATSDGLLGAVTARAPAQVRRLAVIYALLDPKPDGGAVVELAHLQAALAVWDYAHASAAYIFGETLGDPTADAILGHLRSRPEGMTRKQVSDAFGRHKTADELDRALAALIDRGLVRTEQESTGGRPAIRYFAVEGQGSEVSEAGEESPGPGGAR